MTGGGTLAAASTGAGDPRPLKPLAFNAADKAPLPANASTSLRPTKASTTIATAPVVWDMHLHIADRDQIRTDERTTLHPDMPLLCYTCPLPRSKVPDEVVLALQACRCSMEQHARLFSNSFATSKLRLVALTQH